MKLILSNDCELIWVMSNVELRLGSTFWATTVDHFLAKKYFNGIIMTVRLYLVEVFDPR